uniref:Heat shock protein beta-1-like n=1 Tax=Gouania willdenowi TaxID=441366 RepID=A0A8C5DKQ8_GOUWI
MSDSSKTETSCGENIRGSPWYPMRKWWYFNHDAGVTPCVELADPRQMEGFQRSLAAPSWFGFMPTPMFVSFNNGAMNHHGKKIPKWKVSMDVALFSPAEISVSIRDGFLEVKGKHEERPDQHGFTARCFTRKYRLPGDADVTKVNSTLSADGVLTVEVPFAEASAPPAVIIPVKVMES